MPSRFRTAPLAGVLALAALLATSCKKDSDQPAVGSVSMAFENVAGAKALALDGTAYATPSGETFSVSRFEYYVSNVVFTRSDGGAYAAPNVYHLVNAEKASTGTFTINNVPVGDYSAVKFTVGVDSTTTKADPLSFTGLLNDLNSANSMYWTWNSGHIFLKLEGTVTSAANRAITAHIGGYRAPYNAIVTTAPALGARGTTLQVRVGHPATISYSADVLKMFDGVTHVPLSNFPPAMMPSATSVQVAQNYAAGMFSVKRIDTN